MVQGACTLSEQTTQMLPKVQSKMPMQTRCNNAGLYSANISVYVRGAPHIRCGPPQRTYCLRPESAAYEHHVSQCRYECSGVSSVFGPSMGWPIHKDHDQRDNDCNNGHVTNVVMLLGCEDRYITPIPHGRVRESSIQSNKPNK